jgi:hypothetical protein
MFSYSCIKKSFKTSFLSYYHHQNYLHFSSISTWAILLVSAKIVGAMKTKQLVKCRSRDSVKVHQLSVPPTLS